MVNGAFHFLAGADDFGLQHHDAFGQFLDRKRVEVLPRKLSSDVVGATGKIVGVHRMQGWASRGGSQAAQSLRIRAVKP